MNVHSADTIVTYLSELITGKLKSDSNVLLLVPGGSGIGTAVAVAEKLKDTDLSNLTITLTDERFGPVGHADENWQQLLDQGFVMSGVRSYRVLQGGSLQEAAQAFSETLDRFLDESDYTVGLFGIGGDGHTAGIKPGTVAVTESNLVSGYEGSDFQRITTTFSAIQRLDEALLYATGESKRVVLNELLNQSIDLNQQPAQILKTVKKSTVFTDQIIKSEE